VPVYVAFLRAINVGGHTVKMGRLRALLEEVGLQQVSTFIASGNVIFESREKPAALERSIGRHLEKSLGYEVGVFVRTPGELAVVATHPPFSEKEVASANTLYVCFLPKPASGEVAEAVAAQSTPTQLLRVHERELYWLCHTKISESDVDDRALGKALRMPMTMRNLTTVRRILAKVS
jgi:uncharacterized protein (DUF1697 family)